MCAAQAFDIKRRDKMGFHTDSKPDPRRPDQQVSVEKGSPVLSLNVGEDFMFWTVPIVNGDVIDKKQKLAYKEARGFRLVDGMGMLWPAVDDHAFKHGVWCCRDVKTGMRWSLVFRWSALPAERFRVEYPHRIVSD